MLLDRGYTGHEHLSSVGLVHMNGRLYDPAVRRFLGPDNFIQDPYNTQNFNRYSYVLNSPLVYTDPSGESILGAVIIGIAVGVTSNAIINIINDVPWWHGEGKSAVIGGVSGALSCGIGKIASSWMSQALMHGATGGAMSAIDGESFITGFASGAFSSMLSSGLGGISFKSADLRNAVIIASGGLSGGVGSVIAGGNFWKGVRQGLITAGLNHMMHVGYNALEKKWKVDKWLVEAEENGVDTESKPIESVETVYNSINAVQDLKDMYRAGRGRQYKVSVKPGNVDEYATTNGTKKTMVFYTSAFTDYRTLFSTIYHEGVHLLQFAYNKHLILSKKHGRSVTDLYLEFQAYKAEYNISGNVFAWNEMMKYHGVLLKYKSRVQSFRNMSDLNLMLPKP